MRLLLIHWGRNGGGARFFYESAKAFAEQDGVNVHLSYSKEAEIADWLAGLGVPSLPVHTFRSSWSAALGVLRLPYMAWKMNRYCEQHRIDVVYAPMEQVWQSIICSVFGRKGRIYVVGIHDATAHPGDESVIQRLLRRHELRQADGVVAFSQSVRNALDQQDVRPPLGICMTVHPALPSNNGHLRWLPKGSSIKLGFFGRIRRYKGLELLIAATSLLKARGYDVVLQVDGAGEIAGLDGLMEQPYILDRRRWVPESEIEEVVASYDLLILPYLEASQSGVLGVAMASGLPVVATPVGGLSEQVLDSGCGVVSDEVSAESLASAIGGVLDSANEYHRYSVNGLESSTATFSWFSVTAQIRQFLSPYVD